MTLDEINRSTPELRAQIASAFDNPNARILLDAIKEDTFEAISRKPVIEAGESCESSMARWHSFLAGRQDVLKIILGIGKSRPIQSATTQRPFEHAIPEHLRTQPETPKTTAAPK